MRNGLKSGTRSGGGYGYRQAQEIEQGGATLGKFILSRKGQILALWEDAVRRLPTARELPKPVLLDHVPQLLDAIAMTVGARGACESEIAPGIVERLALQRLDTRFDLALVVA